jgi:predicted TIM-barrel fold metal-dependent hydrolase
LWIAADECDPAVVYGTLAAHPGLHLVLCEVHYKHMVWAVPMLKSLPNVNVEISRLVATGGLSSIIEAIGIRRVLYGSRFPDHPMAPQLYHLHRCGLSDASLAAICSGNLERLLKLE